MHPAHSHFPAPMVFGLVGALSGALVFSGCNSNGSENVSGSTAGKGAVIIAGAAATVAAVAVVPVVTAYGVENMLQGNNRGDPGELPDPATHVDHRPTPLEERSELGHYHDDIPSTAQARRVSNMQVEWVGLSASALYLFDSGINLREHTGWGGVVEGAMVFHSINKPWYGKYGLDFIFFDTGADRWRDGALYAESLQSYRVHFNAGGGWQYGDFHLNGWAGLGMGATHSRNTRYNAPGESNTSADALFQLGARVSWQPVNGCEVFAGYRVMWSVPFEYLDDDPQYRHRYPSLSLQSVELGVSFLF